MKMHRSEAFNTSGSEIWGNSVLRVDGGGGPLFVAKAIITGFGLSGSRRKIGPVVLRQYNQKSDKELGSWTGRCCVLELKFEERPIAGPQDTPVSMYVEPFWLMYSLYQGFQVMVDAWVGMLPIRYFSKKGGLVCTVEGGRNQVADTRSTAKEPVIKRLYRNKLFRIIGSQFGRCQLAIDRYSRACTEVVDESVVDFIIVLESLLGLGLGGEPSHRISSRGAFLLSETKEDRQNYYSAIRYFYDLRSLIVHGEIDEIRPPKGDKKRAFEELGVVLPSDPWYLRYAVSDFARSITRRVLLFFIENEGKLDKKWLEQLELGMK